MLYAESLWKGEFIRFDFTFEGRAAIVVFPRAENKTDRWLLKTEYFSAFQELELEMVRAGFHLAYLANRNRWGADEDLHAKARFRDFLAEEFGLNRRCVPVGMSCGGLHAVKLAARHPDMISALYLDAPVINLLSCPMGMGARPTLEDGVKSEMLEALNMTKSDIIAYRDHPLDNIPALIEARIPIVLVCGDADASVPFEENGAHLKRACEVSGAPFLFQMKPGCGHHPHGPADMGEVIAFLLAR